MMIMRAFWMFGLLYMVSMLAVLSMFMCQSDEELSKPIEGPRNPLVLRVGAGMLIAAIAIGALGTLGFLAQIMRQ
jgi:hypothetical protein